MNSTHQPRLSRRGLIAPASLVAVTVFALAGCSGASDAGTSSLDISRGQVNIENSIIAEQEGFFEDEGLDIEQHVSQGAAATNSAVISGEFDIALTEGTSAVRAISEGMPITIVAGQKHAGADHPHESGVLLPPDSPIESWSDLEGAKVGIPELGGLPYLTVVQAMVQNGLDAESIEFVPLPLPALAEAAANGEVDAIFVFSAFFANAISEGFEPLGTGVVEFLPDAPQSVWIARQDFAESNPETLEQFRAAIDTANQYGDANRDAVLDVYHEYTELPAEYIDNVMEIAPLSTDFPVEGLQLLIDVMSETGELADDVTVEDVAWEGAIS